MRQLRIVYDGQCPFCSRYAQLVRLREGFDVHLIDARREQETAASYNLDLNEGMVVDLDGAVHHGAEAISLLSRLSGRPGPLSSPTIARLVYPGLRLGRRVALRLLGRKQI